MLTGRPSQRGSVYLLVLVVMISSMALVTGIQHTLFRRTRNLAQSQTEIRLRHALILGLREGMAVLAADPEPAVDGLFEEWMEPLEFVSSEGVELWVQLEDAQSRLNLNHLHLPVTASMPRNWWDIFNELLRKGEVATDPAQMKTLQQLITEDEVWFASPELLQLLAPDLLIPEQLSDLFTALPHPESRPLKMNVNTVHPSVLDALVGTALSGWVDTVLAERSDAPVRNLQTLLTGLPTQVQGLLSAVLDVRCEYVNARLVAREGNVEMSMTALLWRSRGNVEVLQCQW